MREGQVTGVLARAIDAIAWWPLRVTGDRGGRPRGVLWVWVAWDALLRRIWRSRYVREGGLVLYRVVRHSGPDVRLADGTIVALGDHIVEVHLDNLLLPMLAGGGAAPLTALRAFANDIAALRSLASSGALGDVRAIRGTSLLAPATRHVGAEVHPLPHSAANAFVHYFLVGLVALRHPRGWSAASHYRRRWPAQLWFSLSGYRQTDA
ncbi:MAG TPA: hypothetical protein VE261_01055 [Gaiellaceae bacterium]|nr:hypothetical protein [Gaiellaceae bacterium]